MSVRSIRPLRVLFAWGRMCFPFFVGGDGLLVHHALTGGVRWHDWVCRSIGTFDGGPSPKSFSEILAMLDSMAIPSRVVATEPSRDVAASTIYYNLDQYPCSMVAHASLAVAVRRAITEFAPDIVVTAEEDAEVVIDVAREKGVPSAFLLFHAGWSRERMVDVSARTDLVVFDSEFLLERYQKGLLCPSCRIYPPFNWKEWRAKRSSYRYVSMVNPSPEKGVNIFLAIAGALPSQDFLIQGGWHPLAVRLDDTPNVTYRPRDFARLGNGMEHFMGNTRVLLVPSQMDDALPTVAIQALHNGIPVIGSRKGGIPEVIGDGGILVDDYGQPEAWVAALTRLDSEPDSYGLASRQARQSAARFSYRRELGHLDATLRRLIGRRHRPVPGWKSEK